MPFNIELMNKAGSTREIAIKLQVVKSRINIYFNGISDEAITVRDNWDHLAGHFAANLPDFGIRKSVIIMDGIYHLKKDHTNILERSTVHTHLPFLKEITPELFSLYLYEMYQQQKAHPTVKYQFFQGRDEVENIIKAFGIHYDLYKGSSIEREFNESAKLTPEEKIQHEQAVDAEFKKEVSNTIRDIEELLIASFFSRGHPILGNAPQHESVLQESLTADQEKVDCSIM